MLLPWNEPGPTPLVENDDRRANSPARPKSPVSSFLGAGAVGIGEHRRQGLASPPKGAWNTGKSRPTAPWKGKRAFTIHSRRHADFACHRPNDGRQSSACHELLVPIWADIATTSSTVATAGPKSFTRTRTMRLLGGCCAPVVPAPRRDCWPTASCPTISTCFFGHAKTASWEPGCNGC